jgi:diaminohydroxyphosphoribosylaminopyrimidine deaminase/5-amino-6-(5-phosphoribosylamino)uracil reductase
MIDFTEDFLWELLLGLRDYIKASEGIIFCVTIIFEGDKFKLHSNEIPKISAGQHGIIISKTKVDKEYPNFTAFTFDDNFSFTVSYNHLFDNKLLGLLELYIPFCFLTLKACRSKRTISILHLAQSLDGRIATQSGNSKWISNDENLLHAHRMRALCDAVLIGANTLRIDRPSLTVRHVKGPEPVKIVIGKNNCDFESLLENYGNVLFFTSGKNEHSKAIDTLNIPSINNFIPPSKILIELYLRKIYTLYIEGGSITASKFIQDKSVDFLQLFITPRLFGSGISNFSLPEINDVSESVGFLKSSFIQMGDGILFNGILHN